MGRPSSQSPGFLPGPQAENPWPRRFVPSTLHPPLASLPSALLFLGIFASPADFGEYKDCACPHIILTTLCLNLFSASWPAWLHPPPSPMQISQCPSCLSRLSGPESPVLGHRGKQRGWLLHASAQDGPGEAGRALLRGGGREAEHPKQDRQGLLGWVRDRGSFSRGVPSVALTGEGQGGP